MNTLHYINGATVTATDVRKSWTKIVNSVKTTHQPAFVFTNNVPEAVVLSFDTYQALQNELEMARRNLLGKQMTMDLLEIAELEDRTIPRMKADENGVFRPVEEKE